MGHWLEGWVGEAKLGLSGSHIYQHRKLGKDEREAAASWASWGMLRIHAAWVPPAADSQTSACQFGAESKSKLKGHLLQTVLETGKLNEHFLDSSTWRMTRETEELENIKSQHIYECIYMPFPKRKADS